MLQKNDAVNLSVTSLHERRVDAGRLEPGAVVAEILPGRGHQQRPFAEQRQRVGDVRRASAAALVHRVDEKTEAQPLHVLGQQMLGELARETTSGSRTRSNR